MRSVIESSAYVIILTLICYLGIDFIQMNQQITDVHKHIKYIEDYVCIHGQKVDEQLDAQTKTEIQNYLQQKNMQVAFQYTSESSQYYTFQMQVEYHIQSNLFSIQKQHHYNEYVHIEK